jgi:UDP-N-acetylmuramate--alanine ligase
LIIACADYAHSSELLPNKPADARAFTYGFSDTADYQAVNIKINVVGSFDYDVTFHKAPLCQVSLQVPGEHNVRNSLAVLAAIHALGLPVDQAATHLHRFTGTGRRFDVIGETRGITFVDDYAHHPSKITATLSAARSRYPGRRLVALWQPHTYSRTKTLAADFIRSLELADAVVVTEVYPAREPVESFSSAELVAQMTNKEAYFCKTLDDSVVLLEKKLLPGDVLLVLSAGDADTVGKRVLHDLQERKS